MGMRTRLTSKGQVTIPVRVRRKLGLRQGDEVEFSEKGDETVIRRAPDSENPFDKYIGVLKVKQKHPFNSKKWVAELRDEE